MFMQTDSKTSFQIQNSNSWQPLLGQEQGITIVAHSLDRRADGFAEERLACYNGQRYVRIRGWHVNTFTTKTPFSPTTMTRGKALSNDARSILFKLHQSDEFTMDHLSALTDVNRRTIYRIIKDWEATGGVERDGKRTGRPRLLDYLDVQVRCSVPALTDVAHQDSICHQYLLSSVDQRRDLFLDELRQKLGASSGKYVSDSTIWRTLERAGFTMKRVWSFVFN